MSYDRNEPAAIFTDDQIAGDVFTLVFDGILYHGKDSLPVTAAEAERAYEAIRANDMGTLIGMFTDRAREVEARSKPLRLADDPVF